MKVRRISTREELIKLAIALKVSGDWHENDEVGVTARVHGLNFDNAGFWPLNEVTPHGRGDEAGTPSTAPTPAHAEIHVTLCADGEPVAAVNLATLFAWATGVCGHVSPQHCKAEAADKGYGPR
ncbi:hypothetical protein [Streptomyces sp. NPDC059278]|uniref:hypothetical protein n=1 Tax=Streptomyces sp. NPDC059278 TaxID=3346801 RepID=UPI003676B0EF